MPRPFTLLTPRHVLRVDGVRSPVRPAAGDDLGTAVREALAESGPDEAGEDAVVVGALPFDLSAPDAARALFVPRSLERRPVDDAVRSVPPRPAGAPGGPRYAVRPVPDPPMHEKAVAAALERLERGDLAKVVLARTLEVSGDAPVDLDDLVRRLSARDRRGHTFAVRLDAARPTGADAPGWLVGASPELLVRREGRSVLSAPLAGSAARSADPAEDARTADALLDSAKDQREHRLVVEAIADALAPLCRDLDVPDRPHLSATAALWHLETRITGSLRDPGVTALDLALALHPTPAICGAPVGPARALIDELESFDRGYYTGLVGWTDARGDGEWVLALRCAEVAPDLRALRLFAGGGIVPGSQPSAELAETSAKFRTFLDALGVAAG